LRAWVELFIKRAAPGATRGGLKRPHYSLCPAECQPFWYKAHRRLPSVHTCAMHPLPTPPSQTGPTTHGCAAANVRMGRSRMAARPRMHEWAGLPGIRGRFPIRGRPDLLSIRSQVRH
jgi:hypothetical protein